MNLGEQVIDKISNLLVQVDHPKSQKRKPKKERTRIKRNQENYEQKPPTVYHQPKYRPNLANEKQKQKMYEQLQEMQQFKVQNKKSIFLNSQKDYVPIHQRTPQILRQRELSISQKKLQIEKQKAMKKLFLQEQQQEEKMMQKYQHKVTRKQLNQILKKMTARQNQRLNRQNNEKLYNLKNKLKEQKQKPTINDHSLKMFERRQMERSLSANVFERLQKYEWDQKKRKQEFIKHQREKITPFHPKISKNSRMIVERSPSRIQLTKDLERSTSCKCFSKKKGMNSTFINTTSRYTLTPKRKKNHPLY